MKITVNKSDIRQPRKTWKVKPIQKPHGEVGYKRKKDWRKEA